MKMMKITKESKLKSVVSKDSGQLELQLDLDKRVLPKYRFLDGGPGLSKASQEISNQNNRTFQERLPEDYVAVLKSAFLRDNSVKDISESQELVAELKQRKNLFWRVETLGKISKPSRLTVKDEIDKLSTFEEILQYGIESIKLKDDYFFKRIRELEELCAEEEDVEISLESLKSMFLFVGTLVNISKPSSLTVNDNGFFHLGWKKDKNNSITLEFKKDYFSNYVIFQPSLHINKRIILNGSMYVLDLIDYLNDLKIKIHRYA